MSRQQVWAEKLPEILARPGLLDRMTRSELRECSMALISTVLLTGERCAKAEQDLNRQTAWALSMVGVDQGKWSYVHRDEVLRLAEFSAFDVWKHEDCWLVCGEAAGKLAAIYEYDEEEFPDGEAESLARRMLVHLRQSFQPRNSEIPK